MTTWKRTTWKLMIATSAGATGPVITADIRPEDVAAILELARRSMHEHEHVAAGNPCELRGTGVEGLED